MIYKSLFCEKDDKGEFSSVSLGRVTFWIVFGLAVYWWLFKGVDIHPSHLQMLYITASYNLMKKASWFGSTNVTVNSDGSKETRMQTKVEGDIYEDDSPRMRF